MTVNEMNGVKVDDPYDDKYLVIKRSDMAEIMAREIAMESNPSQVFAAVMQAQVHDAVVIRRQDEFAPMALDVYANMIALVAKLSQPGPRKDELMVISHYFHDQASASHEAVRKLPTP